MTVSFQQGGIGPAGNPGPQGVKGFQVSCIKSLIIIISMIIMLFLGVFLVKYWLCVCVRVCHVLQGVKGGLGDPGLPGPTGLRGEFGDRVSFS